MLALRRSWRPSSPSQVGGKSGYSARNFIAAIKHTRSPAAKVFTVDIVPVPKVADNHIVLTKNASLLEPSDVQNMQIDFLFFDCHDLAAQIALYTQLQKGGLITDETARLSVLNAAGTTFRNSPAAEPLYNLAQAILQIRMSRAQALSRCTPPGRCWPCTIRISTTTPRRVAPLS